MQESNWMFVAAAYAAAWLVIAGYAVHLVRTMRRSRRALWNARVHSSTEDSWQ